MNQELKKQIEQVKERYAKDYLVPPRVSKWGFWGGGIPRPHSKAEKIGMVIGYIIALGLIIMIIVSMYA